MKTLFISFLTTILLFPSGTKAQNSAIDTILPVEENVVVPQQEELIFHLVEAMPEFPGGPDSLMRFIQANLRYPESARSLGIEGKVYVQFVVGKDGNIWKDKIKILRGIPELNEEAIHVIQLMPAWIPGTQRGKPQNVFYTLPINFRL